MRASIYVSDFWTHALQIQLLSSNFSLQQADKSKSSCELILRNIPSLLPSFTQIFIPTYTSEQILENLDGDISLSSFFIVLTL